MMKPVNELRPRPLQGTRPLTAVSRVSRWCLAVTLVGSLGCQRSDSGLRKEGDGSNTVDATRGEKPYPCSYGACGHWRLPDQTSGRKTIQVAISLAANQMSRKTTCLSENGGLRTSQVIVRAQVTASEIRVLQSEVARDSSPGADPCDTRVERTVALYEMRDERRTLAIRHSNGTETLWKRENID